MKIDKIYYEELRSVSIDGKWTNKKIGVGASLDNENGQLSNRIDDLKVIVKRELDRETIGDDSDKYKNAKELLLNIATNIKSEIELIDSGLPF